mgnify:CR=1 FL=1
MIERYQVTLHSQMGPRTGLLSLNQKGNYISGLLTLMGHQNTVQGIRSEDGSIQIFHSICTAVSILPCETILMLQNGHLTGTTMSKSCRIRWEGLPVPDDASEKAAQEELKL